MRLKLEQGMGAPNHAIHGMWGEGGKAKGVLQHWGGEQASVARTLARLSWTTGPTEHGGNHRPEVSLWAVFAGAKHRQLAVLREAAVTAGLHEVVTGVTCLASIRPSAPRLTVASTVLARASKRGGTQDRNHGVEGMDEGGIYSW
ncbi:hypothetical protein [Melittangium boletus]|uniref:Uncharacterized protein n=1 Tax=Melittangium boletus DSM 14713 TaxID=1294270 RepID=A0A250IHB4_9BACT|nr:hypothetical protein [Melittangium boletus]ATB30557.1 hypothetical protein MEBOL_004018 [Melittangium boletus DSM 14713]